jgi:hypothetical protein
MATYSSSARIKKAYECSRGGYYSGFGPVECIPTRFRVRVTSSQSMRKYGLTQIMVDLTVVKCLPDPKRTKFWQKPGWMYRAQAASDID